MFKAKKKSWIWVALPWCFVLHLLASAYSVLSIFKADLKTAIQATSCHIFTESTVKGRCYAWTKLHVSIYVQTFVWKRSGTCHISCLFSIGFPAKTVVRHVQQVYCQPHTPRLLWTLVKSLSYERSFLALSFSSRGSLNICENFDTLFFWKMLHAQ